MLERVTDFHSHPELLFGSVSFPSFVSVPLPHVLTVFLLLIHRANVGTPEERFIRVLQYYLAGWHIKPKGVKKPYVLALFPALPYPLLAAVPDQWMEI